MIVVVLHTFKSPSCHVGVHNLAPHIRRSEFPKSTRTTNPKAKKQSLFREFKSCVIWIMCRAVEQPHLQGRELYRFLALGQLRWFSLGMVLAAVLPKTLRDRLNLHRKAPVSGMLG